MPHALVRRNMQRVAGVLREMRTVLSGLTRGLDLSLLDKGHGEHEGHVLSFYPRTDALGVVLPSNSPGVHSLWPGHRIEDATGPKPGSAEPWTPFRIAQAFMRAGCPPEAFSYYPSDQPALEKSFAAPAGACSSATSPPSAAGKAIRASSCMGPGTARS